MIVNYKGKRISIDCAEAGFFRRGFGLMFCFPSARPLLFRFSKIGKTAFTSLFVFFPFLILWLDKKNKVIEFKIVKPFTTTILSKKPFYSVLEVPFHRQNRHILRFFVGKRGKI